MTMVYRGGGARICTPKSLDAGRYDSPPPPSGAMVPWAAAMSSETCPKRRLLTFRGQPPPPNNGAFPLALKGTGHVRCTGNKR